MNSITQIACIAVIIGLMGIALYGISNWKMFEKRDAVFTIWLMSIALIISNAIW